MVTTVRDQPRAALAHLWTWLQAAGLVYVSGFGMALLGAAVVLPIFGLIELVSWIAGLMR
jgi:hypothetical protein